MPQFTATIIHNERGDAIPILKGIGNAPNFQIMPLGMDHAFGNGTRHQRGDEIALQLATRHATRANTLGLVALPNLQRL